MVGLQQERAAEAVHASGRIGLAVAMAMALFVALTGLGVYALRSLPGPVDHGFHESPAVRHPEVAGFRVVKREVVQPPTAAYSFRLVGHTGAPVSLGDLAGKVVLLGFVYTNCPEACPLLTEAYLQLQERFASQMERGELALVFITTDPEHDTPSVLQDYTLGRGGKWLFLSGDLPSLQGVWDGYQVYRKSRKDLREVVVYHSYKTFLFDGQGMIRYQYEGVWQQGTVAPDIQELLEAAPR
ncbi:MAG: SCO family protein [Chloroflexi bacterium]|nr:SCO family protein [Chloroflexota bacterium]